MFDQNVGTFSKIEFELPKSGKTSGSFVQWIRSLGACPIDAVCGTIRSSYFLRISSSDSLGTHLRVDNRVVAVEGLVRLISEANSYSKNFRRQ